MTSRRTMTGMLGAAVVLLTAQNVLTIPRPAQAQADVITANRVAGATVETVDHAAGEVLLRDDLSGDLFKVIAPRRSEIAKLPRLKAGDHLYLRFVQTIGVELADPGARELGSTSAAAGGSVHRHPHGTMLTFIRQRVTINATDAASHTVTFTDHQQVRHTVPVTHKALQSFVETLHPGDGVDVTTTEAVTFVVTNRTIQPRVSVTDRGGIETVEPIPHP